MRRHRRTDANHAKLRDQLRAVTVVDDISDVGRGMPDLIARHLRTGHAVLLEVKDPSKPPSRRELTPAETLMQSRWGAAYVVVLTLDDALRAVGAK